jgi:hypothetical protein
MMQEIGLQRGVGFDSDDLKLIKSRSQNAKVDVIIPKESENGLNFEQFCQLMGVQYSPEFNNGLIQFSTTK